MTRIAKGSFTVVLEPQGDGGTLDGVAMGRMSLDKRFEGDLAATSRGEMLSALTAIPGSAGYVAIERVEGTLHDQRGSFVLLHRGVMTRGDQDLTITVVPDSGTGALAGLAGTFRLTIVDRKHLYELEYTLPEA